MLLAHTALMGSGPCVIHCGGVCIYSIFPALFLLFLGVLILSTSYTNVCSAPCKKNGSIQVWSTISCSLCFGIFFLLFNFDSSCMVLIWYIRSEWALSFYSPGNSICVFKVAVCALSVVLCLFLVQYNVIHQYISTRPHPVRAYLNVNIIRGRHHCLSFYLVPCCPI